MPAPVDIIPQSKCAPTHLGRVLLLGLGVSGQAAKRYCEKLVGTRVEILSILTGTAYDGFTLTSMGVEASTEQTYTALDDISDHFDLCIASPGISEHSDIARTARALSTETISEVEFAWRESAADSRWVAITGTNGKTTTTALTAHLLQAAGFRAAAVGNIGDTCIDAVAAGETDVYVTEVSSYQLASTQDFAPDVAVMLNISPDHISWHGSFEAYVQAKAKLLANLSACKENTAVLDACNDQVRALLRTLRDEGRCAYIPVGTAAGIEGDMRAACGSSNAAFLRAGQLVVALGQEEYELAATADLLLKGQHNYHNALMACAAALALGAAPEAVSSAVKTFAPLEHRLEPCGSIRGVSCYNDSKATNVDSTRAALEALSSEGLIVLLGGDDKGTDLSILAQTAQETCVAAVCFGAAGPRFFEALDATSLPHLRAEKLSDALDAALEIASAGDVILLSPACASFDEFDNFEHRGHVFKELVAKRQE